MARRAWWRDAVVYQVYVRSFADANGDGTGDLAGVREHGSRTCATLGVDALWFNPWYPSPLADGGYDVVDYRAIDPAFGTLADAEQLIAEARALGIRTIVDIVPNHVSDEHPWFREALARQRRARPRASASGSGPASGADGELPPNDWQSIFGGSAWTRTTRRTASGTCTCSPPSSPTSTGTHPEVWAEHEDMLRFWFDRGVAGVRIDSAALLVKDPELPRSARRRARRASVHRPGRAARHLPALARDRRHLRGAADPRRRGLAAGRRAASRATCAPTSCTPRSTSTSSRARGSRARCARRSSRALAAHAPVDAPATWVLSNHDVTRPVTRYGRADTSLRLRGEARRARRPISLAARAGPGRGAARDGAARLDVHLPGRGARPAGGRGHPRRAPPGPDVAPLRRRRPGRDGCRVPLPWSGPTPPYGFSPTRARGSGSTSRTTGRALTVEAETDDPASMLEPLPRRACACAARRPGARARLCAGSDRRRAVLAFARGERFACLVNFGPDPVELPAGADVLIASDELEGGALPQDTDGLAPPGRDQLRQERPRPTGSRHRIGQRKEGR